MSSEARIIRSADVAQQLQLLVDGVADYAIFLLDAGGHIRTWNTGAREIKGYEAGEILGQHFSVFYTDADRARDHPAHELEIAQRDGRFEEEGWRVRKDGSQFWANVVITPLYDGGRLIGYGKVTRDLTERRAAEQALRATADELARSNAELERFAAAAAHDLVEPLHTMTGMAELVVRLHGEALGEDGRALVGHIADGAHRLQRLIDGLLAYASASGRELEGEPVAVADLVAEVVAGLRRRIDERGAIVACELDPSVTVWGDRSLLELVLQNLVSNGLKFNDAEHPRVDVLAEQRGDGWRITVADDGIGIAPERLEQIFALFRRLHPQDRYPGAGIGLALSQRIVERHGGSIGVESVEGDGSRFWFTLPAPAA